MKPKDIYLAHTQGFCAGVVNAVEIVERSIKKFGTPLYVRHAIVHNTSVIQDFESRGVVFVECLSEIPDHSVIVFSAHGTAPDVYETAKTRHIQIIDATCPLVTKVHHQARRYSERGYHVILIGHRDHQELIGTSGCVSPDQLHIVEDKTDIDQLFIPKDATVSVLTQTTLSVDDTAHLIQHLRDRYPDIITGSKEDICYATQNRQNAVKSLSKQCDVVVVVGSSNSSNSNRLVETATLNGADSFIIDFPEELDVQRLHPYQTIGITSGASVPSYLVNRLLDRIKAAIPIGTVHTFPSVEEGISFPLPRAVRDVPSCDDT